MTPESSVHGEGPAFSGCEADRRLARPNSSASPTATIDLMKGHDENGANKEQRRNHKIDVDGAWAAFEVDLGHPYRDVYRVHVGDASLPEGKNHGESIAPIIVGKTTNMGRRLAPGVRATGIRTAEEPSGDRYPVGRQSIV